MKKGTSVDRFRKQNNELKNITFSLNQLIWLKFLNMFENYFGLRLLFFLNVIWKVEHSKNSSLLFNTLVLN